MSGPEQKGQISSESQAFSFPRSLPMLPEGKASNLKFYSPTQLHFLLRISHFQRMRRSMVNIASDEGDWRFKLVNKALYSTYRDCEELGVAEEARLLIRLQTPENT